VAALRRSLLVGLSLVAGSLVAATAAVPALASGQVCAGIVIDEGTGGTHTQAAKVPPGSSDLDLMSAAGDAVTQNTSGLVCAINGYPPNGLQDCLEAAHGLYYYWSYWEGDPTTNTWTYANVGPAEHTVAAGQSYVEGWRYQDPGPDTPAAPKPSVSPAAAFATACPSSSPVPTTSVTPTTSAPTTTSTSGSPASGRHARGRGSAPSAIGHAVGGGRVGATSTTATPRGGVGSAPPPTSRALPTSTTSTTITKKPPGLKNGTAKLALSSESDHRNSGGAPILPIVVVVVVVGSLCIMAWIRWRRRPREG
jgi:hypothetical protein